MAAQNLQHLLVSKDINHNFGLNKNTVNPQIGKMFGVLVCESSDGEIGYLAAVSGELLDSNTSSFLVPSITTKIEDSLEKEKVVLINQKINLLESSEELLNLKKDLELYNSYYDKELYKLRQEKAVAKKERKIKRQSNYDENELIKESIHYKKKIEVFKKESSFVKHTINVKIDTIEAQIKCLKNERSNILNELQFKIFSKYQF